MQKDETLAATREAKRERVSLTGAEMVVRALKDQGVTHIFGYPGGAVLPIYDARFADNGITHVLVRHEQGATHMADGFARASGEVGVAVTTSGPGATNAVTGIATAMLDSSPIVCITGQVGSKLIGSDAFQEVDITGVTLPITKHNYLVTHASEVARTIREAFYVAKSGRPGPVLVDITKDAQQGTCEFDWEAAKPQLPGYRPDLSPAPQEYAQALELIHNSKRPVILAGHGVIISGAMREVRDFAERAGIPVALTLLGLGALPASHPLNLGMMGMHGEAWVNHTIQEADLLLAFGMRFDDRVTGTLKTYAPNAKKIHIEIDPAEINKNVKVDVPLVGDLREVLLELLPHVESIDRSEWLDSIDKLKGDSAVRDIQNLPDSGHLYAAHVIHDLWRATGGKAIVVTDVGQHQMWCAQFLNYSTPRSHITSGGLGTMGFSLPAAMGAAFGRSDVPVISISGDGGFQMNLQEMATIVEHRLPIKVFVINNGFLGMVRQWQELFYGERYSSSCLVAGGGIMKDKAEPKTLVDAYTPNFVKLAEAHGALGIRVTKKAEVTSALEQALKEVAHRTVVLEVVIDQHEKVFPMVPAGKGLDDIIVDMA